MERERTVIRVDGMKLTFQTVGYHINERIVGQKARLMAG
jgi:hypothetical protein